MDILLHSARTPSVQALFGENSYQNKAEAGGAKVGLFVSKLPWQGHILQHEETVILCVVPVEQMMNGLV